MKDLVRNISALLSVLAAVNWGTVGLFDTNFIHTIFASMPIVEKGIYILFGVAGIVFGATQVTEKKHFE